jgi:hypothetical protein
MDRISSFPQRSTFTYRPELPQPYARRQYRVGDVHLKSGERLGFYAGTHQANGMASGSFINQNQQMVGFSDVIPQNLLINYIFVFPEFRHRGYSAAILEATLLGLGRKAFSDKPISSVNAYIRNPFMGRTVIRHGFAPIKRPDYFKLDQDARLEIVLSPYPDTDGKVPLFVRDRTREVVFKKFCQAPNNPDWAYFKVVEHPIEGDNLEIFSTYYLTRPELLQREISASGNGFSFIL